MTKTLKTTSYFKYRVISEVFGEEIVAIKGWKDNLTAEDIEDIRVEFERAKGQPYLGEFKRIEFQVITSSKTSWEPLY